jgi:hypothetical protein
LMQMALQSAGIAWPMISSNSFTKSPGIIHPLDKVIQVT